MDLWINLPAKDVLRRLEGHMARQGFGVPALARTETTAVFIRSVILPKGCAARIMDVLNLVTLMRFFVGPEPPPTAHYRVKTLSGNRDNMWM